MPKPLQTHMLLHAQQAEFKAWAGGERATNCGCTPHVHATERQSSAKGGPKRLLIMMSNTGGGHRASAEAIRDAFQEKYGDDYQVRAAGATRKGCRRERGLCRTGGACRLPAAPAQLARMWQGRTGGVPGN